MSICTRGLTHEQSECVKLPTRAKKTYFSHMYHNILLRSLCVRFNQEQYNIETIITTEEINFATHLENLIKDAVDNELFVGTYSTLSFENVKRISDPLIIEEDIEAYEGMINDNKKVKIDVTLDYKKKSVEFWRSGNKKFKTVKHRFKKVTDRTLLYK